MQAVGGTTFTATPGQAKNGIGVIVRDQHGTVMSNVTVSFVAEGGQVSPATATTDAAGQAMVGTWTLPTALGDARLRVTVPSRPSLPAVVFTATVNAGPAAKVGRSTDSPATQQATAGTAVAIAPAVLVTDAWDNPIPNHAVTFSVTAGGGQVTGATQTTNTSGIARVGSWVLGSTIGSNTLIATASGSLTGNPVSFTADGTAGPPATIVVNPATPGAQNQSAVAGTTVAVAPSVRVTDANDNASAGTILVFEITAGGGKVLSDANTEHTSFEVTTNSTGVASVFGWRLGAIGTNTLKVSVKNNASVFFNFNATGTVGPPAQIEQTNAPWGYVLQGTTVGGTPRVVVKDAGGNVIANQSVTWSATGTGSSVSGTTTSQTNAQGVASFAGTWTATGTVNTNITLRATVTGSSPALTRDFTSRIVGAQTQAAVSAGNNQTAPISSDLPVRPAVVVRDANNNPVPGISVTFAVTSGGGSVTGATQLTDSVGVATVGNWRLGTVVGTQNLSATPSGLAAVPFTATATAGTPTSIAISSGNNQTTTVNSTVSISVVVRDASNNPVPNVSVRFTPQTGTNAAITAMTPTGTITNGVGTTTTNASGIATATWRLDTIAGNNTLVASLPSHSSISPANFTATGTALAASKIVIDAGDAQTAPVNTAVATAPRVKVTDTYNNPVAATVLFTHFSGPATSTISPSSATTTGVTSSSTTGLAAITSWTLGSVAGTYQLRAALSANTAINVTFNATATAAEPSCNTAHTLGTSTSGTLTTSDCTIQVLTGTQTYVDYMTFTIASGQQRLFNANVTAGFTPRILSAVYDPATAYWYSDSPPVLHLLGAGSHRIGVTTTNANQTGSYTFSTTVNPSLPDPTLASTACVSVIVTRGVSHSGGLNTGCTYTPPSAAGRTGTYNNQSYFIYVRANETITVRLNSTAFDAYLEAYENATGTFIDANDDGGTGTNSLLAVTGGTSGRFVRIRASVYHAGTGAGTTGSYTFIVD